MRDQVLMWPTGKKKLNGVPMTVSALGSEFRLSSASIVEEVEALIVEGYLKPMGARLLPGDHNYSQMLLERTDKKKTFRRI